MADAPIPAPRWRVRLVATDQLRHALSGHVRESQGRHQVFLSEDDLS